MNHQTLTLLIVNGKAASNKELRESIQILRKEKFSVAVRVTWEQGDGARYVQEALALKASTIIAAGGDGTINEIATALAGYDMAARPVLGIVPLGTANDFATSAGIPQAPENALRLAIQGKAYAIDLAQVNEKHAFINMATGGFGTRITTTTPETLKNVLGGVSYVIQGMLRPDQLKADSCTIRGADFHWQGDALVIAIGNGQQAGGGQRLCPQARINNGLLDMSIITAQEVLPVLLNALIKSADNNPNIIRTSLSWLEISAAHDMTFNLDGEPLTDKRFRIDILPGALRCRLPPDCPLLR
ncbi:lipid kinase YegS [Enterobacteriaceae bacterium LUAb1]